MCCIITDIPLNQALSNNNNVDSDDFDYGCISLKKAKDEYLSRFVHGRSSFNDLLNEMMHTSDIEWNVYYPRHHRSNEVTIQLLFVYEYLRHGHDIIIYIQDGIEQFHPELPVSSIDVSEKREGHTPLDCAWLENDVMYHFYSKNEYSFDHDVDIIRHMGSDIPFFKPSYAGFVPSAPISVGELQHIVGNAVGMISIHDYDKAIEAIKVSCETFDRLISPPFEPLEVMMTDDARAYVEEDGLFEGEILDHLTLTERQVKLYALYSSGSQCPDILGFGDGSTPVPPDMFALAIMVDNSYS